MDIFAILSLIGGLALFLYGMNVMAVSYTHLDVYKRQRWKSADSGCRWTAGRSYSRKQL